MRWLALPSNGFGEDWEERILEIDHSLESQGYELAEESIYLIYSHSARDILSGHGHCLVARPVIGPKKSPGAPFLLKDWTASEVWKRSVGGATLEDLLVSVDSVSKEARGQEKPLVGGFILCLHRKLEPGLSLTIEAIFPE
jgi:hypothetical protein